MYKQIDNADVMTEINSGKEVYVVDIPTQRVMSSDTLTMGSINSFLEKPSTMFFKKVIADE